MKQYQSVQVTNESTPIKNQSQIEGNNLKIPLHKIIIFIKFKYILYVYLSAEICVNEYSDVVFKLSCRIIASIVRQC